MFQFAVNKDGIIRGNYYDGLMDTTTPVYGSVDKKTQRAAWTIGKTNDRVFEAGIYNLTQDQTPVLVHLGTEKTEQLLLVRLKDQAADQTTIQPQHPRNSNPGAATDVSCALAVPPPCPSASAAGGQKRRAIARDRLCSWYREAIISGVSSHELLPGRIMSDQRPSELSRSNIGPAARSAVGRASTHLSRIFGGSSTLQATGKFLRRQLWAWPIIAAVLFGGAGWWVSQKVEEAMRDDVVEDMTTILDADVAALQGLDARSGEHGRADRPRRKAAARWPINCSRWLGTPPRRNGP